MMFNKILTCAPHEADGHQENDNFGKIQCHFRCTEPSTTSSNIFQKLRVLYFEAQ